MKIRCIGKENPPCKRCAHMKLSCRFEMGGVPRMGPEEFEAFSRATKHRLEGLEGQVGGINSKLDDISAFLRGMQRTPLSAVSAVSASPFTTYTQTSTSTTLGRADTGDHQPSTVERRPEWPTPDERGPAPMRSESEDEEDPIELAVTEPLRDLTRRAEKQRLRADGYDVGARWETGTAPRKRPRTEGAVPPVREHSNVWYSADPVTLGWCSEAEGRELFQA